MNNNYYSALKKVAFLYDMLTCAGNEMIIWRKEIQIKIRRRSKNREQLTSCERQVLLLNSLRWRFLDIDLHLFAANEPMNCRCPVLQVTLQKHIRHMPAKRWPRRPSLCATVSLHFYILLKNSRCLTLCHLAVNCATLFFFSSLYAVCLKINIIYLILPCFFRFSSQLISSIFSLIILMRTCNANSSF